MIELWLLPLLRVSTPILFAAMGGLLSERSGVIQLGLEGAMLLGAFSGATFAHHMGSAWGGLLGAVLAGIFFGLIQAFGVLRLKIDQVVLGMALNLAVIGATPVLCKIIFGASGTSAEIPKSSLFNYGPMIWALLLPIVLHYMFRVRRRGLWIQIAGEHPDALNTAGVSVEKVRFGAILASTVCASIGGMTLSVMLSSGFSRGMTAGRGYMALAAVIFGQWKPLPTMAAALFFGLVDLLQNRLQGVPLWGEIPLPTQFLQSIPYVLTVIILSGLFKKWLGEVKAPRTLGKSLSLFAALALSTSILGCSKLRSNKEAQSPVAGSASKVHADRLEILAEATRILTDREQDARILYGVLENAAAQNASIEGLVRGILYSRIFYRLEHAKTVGALLSTRSYVEKELRFLGEDIKSMSFSPIERVSIENIVGVATAERQRVRSSPSSLGRLEAASAATLKRIVIESVFRWAQTHRSHWEAIKKAYLEDTIRLNLEYADLDFGVKLRSSKEADFHSNWIADLESRMDQDAVLDRMLWEMINRKIRIINALEKSR